jgi:hypothetical protein
MWKTAQIACSKPFRQVVNDELKIPETIIFMLATTSIGALWSSYSPDFGIKWVMDRFGQIQPKVLVTAEGYFFKGKPLSILERVSGIIEQIPSIEKVVWCRTSPMPRNLPFFKLCYGQARGPNPGYKGVPIWISTNRSLRRTRF